jgi:hypothetical protein
VEYNRFDGRQLQIDQKQPHECNKVCKWWWLASHVVVEKTFERFVSNIKHTSHNRQNDLIHLWQKNL